MLSWGGSCPRFEPGEFIRHEKEAHDNKVRVRHFLSLVDGNVAPNWDNEGDDENVTIMVRDILDDHIIPTAWDVSESQVCMRKKRKVYAPIIDSNYSTNPGVKDQQTNGDNENGGASNAAGNVTQDNDVYSVLHKLTDKVDTMGTDISNKLLAGSDAAIETKLDAAIETKLDARLNPITEMMAAFEKELNKLKGKNVVDISEEADNSNTNEDEEVSSNRLSWMGFS
uniref:Uncharacterized protein n=1 Tax=Noccaea caerulescens TaxID=107243 RepID=A0A1J3CTZ4_NOCCA